MTRGRYTKKALAKMKRAVPLTRQRQFKHVLESYLDRGYSLEEATSIAAAVTNKFRAKQARRRRGPKLVTKGGSRRQWYPGKKTARERFVCLEHGKRYKSKASLVRHYKSVHGMPWYRRWLRNA